VIDLYAAPTSNGLRAKIMCDESGLPYTLHVVDMAKGEHKKPEFLKMNPNGAIPVIIDSDGPGGKPMTMTQSAAILVYLAEKSGKLMPKDPGKRAAMWQALMSAASDIGMTLGTVFGIARSKEPHKPTQEMFEGRFKDYLKVWDDTLAKQPFAAGDEFTIADIALFGVTYRARQAAPALVEPFANITRWEKKVAERPGVAKGLKFS
jgi:GST-like protein